MTSDSIGTGNGATVTFAATLTVLPIAPSTVVVKDAGVAVATDDGNGNIVGAGITSGTINYTTGAISVTFTVAPVNLHALTAEHKLVSKRAVITAIDTTAKTLGICFRTTVPGSAPNYGRSDVSAYNGGTVNQDEQLIYNVNDKPLD